MCVLYCCLDSGTLAADIVEFEVKRALEWLEGDRSEQRRYAAVLVLKELADNTPTLFNVHVATFVDHIWVTLRDPKLQIREAAIDALRHCLLLISKRALRLKIQRYDKIFQEIQQSFKSNNSDSIHGALLAIGEVLVGTGDYMLPRFKEVCESVMKYKDHRDKLVRECVISLLPKLAAFQVESFSTGYLETSVTHVISTLKSGQSRDVCFLALGELALAVKEKINTEIDVIMSLVKDGLTFKRSKPFVPEALTCIAMLSRALGIKITAAVNDLLESMFSNGLSTTLVSALTQITQCIPSLLASVQDKLLTAISIILASSPHTSATSRDARRISTYRSMPTTPRSFALSVSLSPSSDNTKADPNTLELVQLAIQTLGSFNFEGHNLLPFVRDCVLHYLDHDNPHVRRRAAVTCAQLLLRPNYDGRNVSSSIYNRMEDESAANSQAHLSEDDSMPYHQSASSSSIVVEVMERLTTVGISDSDLSIRKTVLESLDSRFDHFLSQAHTLHSLFVALNDEHFPIRESAMMIIGRVAARNPAHIMPSLRKTLIQLLTELQYGGDSRQREESARLLSHLITAAHTLIKPYVPSILRVLVPRLRDSDANVASCALGSLGSLASIGAEEITGELDSLLPLIITVLNDKSSLVKRDVALRTLTQLISCTGAVIQPYEQYPSLLPSLLNFLKQGQNWTTRREVIKLIGVLGALDPFRFKMNQQATLAASSNTAPDGEGERKNDDENKQLGNADITAAPKEPAAPAANGNPTDKAPAAPAITSMAQLSDDYYPTVAIGALMRILREPALSQHHNKVSQAVMFIVRSLGGSKTVPFLPLLVPPFLSALRWCEDSLRESLFQQLGFIVSIVRANIRSYLDGIFSLIQDYWNDNKLLADHLLPLVEKICAAMKDEFKLWLPTLLPRMLSTLHTDRTSHRSVTIKLLHALEVFSTSISDYLHLIIPALIRLAEHPESPNQVRLAAVHGIQHLARIVPIPDYASRIIHPLTRMLDAYNDKSTSSSSSSSAAKSQSSALRDEILSVFCFLVYQLGSSYAIFVPTVGKIMTKHHIRHERYELLVDKILNNHEITTADVASLKFNRFPFSSEAGAAADTSTSMSDDDFDNPSSSASDGTKKLQVNQNNLKKAWEVSQRSTRDDWVEWMRGFSIELLKESPSPALRACSILAQKYHLLARELFNAAFVSCWSELADQFQDDLVRCLEAAFASPTFPPELVQHLLNLAEFMAHNAQRLPIDIRALGRLAENVHAYAKALHYKELEFRSSPANTIESLIHLNNQLQQPEAAVGILNLAKQGGGAVMIAESWYEKLQRWEDALEAYERRQLEQPNNTDLTLGRIRCLRALGEWERVEALGMHLWSVADDSIKRELAPLVASGAYNLGRWDDMEKYLSVMEQGRAEGSFFRALLSVHRNEFNEARLHIDQARELLDSELSALVGESYQRAYRSIVQVQQLAELEEIIVYKETKSQVDRANIRSMWSNRLNGCQRDVDVWQQVLVVRSMVLSPHQDIPTWLKFSSLCRKSGRLSLSLKLLTNLLGLNIHHHHQYTDPSPKLLSNSPQVTFAYCKHLWSAGFRNDAYVKMGLLVKALDHVYTKSSNTNASSSSKPGNSVSFSLGSTNISPSSSTPGSLLSTPQPLLTRLSSIQRTAALLSPQSSSSSSTIAVSNQNSTSASSTMYKLCARAHLKLGEWQLSLADQLDDTVLTSVLSKFEISTILDPSSYKVWHNWAVMNFRAVTHLKQRRSKLKEQVRVAKRKQRKKLQSASSRFTSSVSSPSNAFNEGAINEELKTIEKSIAFYVVPAIRGFFRSIGLAGSQGLQDILRLLTLWFAHGMQADVEAALQTGFDTLPIDTWLPVIPQIIARIDTSHVPVRRMIGNLLSQIGCEHPQSLVYPLTVAAKSISVARKQSAIGVLNSMRVHSSALVEQAMMVSRELIRVAILWHEMWHEALEEASRQWFGQKNVEGMISTLAPLHRVMSRGPHTLSEIAFVQSYGRDLAEAWEWCHRYSKYGADSDLNQAWDLYCSVFRRINKQLSGAGELELQYISPRLMSARNLSLAMPGTYLADRDCADTRSVTIARFIPSLKVIESKQRPRRLKIMGSDGVEYAFLLKGHEDLRQDKRVMQLFGLINTLLANDAHTGQKDLAIRGYSVIPLAPNSGLIQWLSHCDTLHALIKDYRDSRKVLLNIEHRLMLQMAPDYLLLTNMQKVQVFEYALSRTTGQDIAKVLWLKSANCETWLDRRTNYTRSLAVMSMVGYVLGLGDRHPCNLMLDRISGKIIHIDFGDCFEVAMQREKFPERIPFRLTRMLINAMEVSGIEGNFRSTAQHVMRVMRDNKESVMAVLEAFVYDPLINWRLLQNKAQAPKEHTADATNQTTKDANGMAETGRTERGVTGENRRGEVGDLSSLKTAKKKKKIKSSAEGSTSSSSIDDDSDSIEGEEDDETASASSIEDDDVSQSLAAASTSTASIHARAKRTTSSSSAGTDASDDEEDEESESSSSDSMSSYGPDMDGVGDSEIMNAKALTVIARVESKLLGKDFGSSVLDVEAQVDQLVKQATNHINLCQCYIGWCPFW